VFNSAILSATPWLRIFYLFNPPEYHNTKYQSRCDPRQVAENIIHVESPAGDQLLMELIGKGIKHQTYCY
jgi:hypothetical protein